MKTVKIQTKRVWGVTLLRIVEQSHRWMDFGEKKSADDKYSNSFTHNGFVLVSYSIPKIIRLDGKNVDNMLYVRGEQEGVGDAEPFIAPSGEWLNKCRKAVKAYNEYFK